MKFLQTLQNSEKSILREIQNCHLLIYKDYKIGDIIMDYTDNNTDIGILLSGKAELICYEHNVKKYLLESYEPNGKKYLLESYEPNDLFGSIISLAVENKSYLVIAKTDCTVAFLNYNKFIKHCDMNCTDHHEILKNLLILMSIRSKYLSLRVNFLCKSTVREKILTYLQYNRLIFESDSFTIPITLVKLSQYLCVDRRSLTREIRKLNEEKIISSSGRKFKLLYPQNKE